MAEPRLRRKADESPGLADHSATPRDDGVKNNATWNCRSLIIFVLVTLCVFETLGLYHYAYPRNDSAVRDDRTTTADSKAAETLQSAATDEEIMKRFPGFFKSEDEIKAVLERLNEQKNDKESTGPPVHHHGCCKTYGSLRTPKEGYNAAGKKKKIVQLEKHKQHFYYEISTQADPCHCKCKCIVHPVWVSAVYVDDRGGLDVQVFNVSYVYKCFT